ncbi:MAG: hypothetical protein WC378_09040 [Opitutaceae bacterium]
MITTDQAFFDLLLPHGETFTPAQLGAALGRSDSYIRDQIDADRLAAIRASGRVPRKGERRCRREANASFLILRRDALLWLCEGYTQTPQDFQNRLCDVLDRLPQAMLWRIRDHVNKRVRAC